MLKRLPRFESLIALSERIETAPSVSRVVLIAVILLAALLAYLRLTPAIDWGDDWAGYVMQTRALAEASLPAMMQHNSFTILNSPPPLGPIAYPWGYPVLLLPWYAWFGLNWLALKTVGWLAFVAALPVLYALFRRRLSAWSAIWIVAAIGFNSEVSQAVDWISSDAAFLLFSLVGLVLIEHWIVQKRQVVPTTGQAAGLALVLFVASTIRINGLLLLVALATAQLNVFLTRPQPTVVVRRDWLRLLWPYIIFGGLYAGSFLVLPDGGLSQIISARAKPLYSFSEMVTYYLNLPALLYLPSQFRFILYGASLPFGVVGLLRNFRNELHWIVYCGLTLALLLALPFVQGVRYLYPVVPFYFYFVVQGVRAGWAIPERWRWLSRGLHGLVLLGVVGYFGFAAGRIARGALAGQNWPPGPLDRDGRAMFAFIQHFTQPADVIVFFKPRAMWLLTGRDSYSADECGKLSGGDYVVIHQKIGPARQVDPVLVPKCYSGVAVYSNPTFVVYKTLVAISK